MNWSLRKDETTLRFEADQASKAKNIMATRARREEQELSKLEIGVDRAQQRAGDRLGQARAYLPNLEQTDIETDAKVLFGTSKGSWLKQTGAWLGRAGTALVLAAQATWIGIKRLPSTRVFAGVFALGVAMAVTPLHIPYVNAITPLFDGMMWTALSMNYARSSFRRNSRDDVNSLNPRELRSRLFHEEVAERSYERTVHQTHAARRDCERQVTALNVFAHKCDRLIEHEQKQEEATTLSLDDAINAPAVDVTPPQIQPDKNFGIDRNIDPSAGLSLSIGITR